MAGFKMHVTVSSLCGIGYGLATVKMLGHPLETAFLAGGLTAIGGMLPDLDSDSGVPVRELSGVAAAVVPLLLYNRLHYMGINHEAVLAILAAAYFLIRYGAAAMLRRISVHRGMFHSLPAMVISGLLVYLMYDNRAALQSTRYVLGVGVMLGFLSHLILDEIYSVDINGLRFKLKTSAGSALKFFSSSITASMVCYGMLGALLYLSYTDYKQRTGTDPVGEQIQTWRGSR
jgi:membrane-bound metal-dependent hydrolase YbcI (DUF457 family)